MKKIKVTIDRSKWACASNNSKMHDESALETAYGMKCCLGFLANACGIKRLIRHGEIGLRGTLEDLGRTSQRKIPTAFLPTEDGKVVFNGLANVRDNGTLHERCIKANDSVYDNWKRENKITALFHEGGVTVTFKGKYL